MKKKIVSKTLLFIGIILFVNMFNSFFGKENSLVGISTIIIALVLLTENLTDNILKNTTIIFCVNVGIGLASYIAANNIWIGFLINFLVLASIGYYLSYNLTKNLIVAFGLEYMFLLYAPVDGIIFGKRMLGLILGVVLIMGLQMIVHKKKVKVEESKILEFENKDEDDSKTLSIFGKDIKIHPVRAGYAIRVGLLTAITSFVTGYLGLNEGRWMAFTVFSLTELYSERCKIKSKQRLEGTIIGACIVIILFMFIKNSTIRALTVVVAGYLNSYTTNYRDTIICVTVSVVAAMGITDGSVYSSVERIGYVLIGIVISLIANKLIFNFSEQSNNTKVTMS